jgi:hypothetical protein
MLVKHINRIRLQDPAAVITAQKLRDSIEMERKIAQLSRRRTFKPDEIYETLHGGGPVRTTFMKKSNVYQYFRNKIKALADKLDQSFRANSLIDALAQSARDWADPHLLGRWKALHDFIDQLPIRIKGKLMTYAEKRAMLGLVWEDIYMRIVMNVLGPPNVVKNGVLWSYHIRIDGANFDSVIIRKTGNEVVIEVVDAKLSGAPLSADQKLVVPDLENLEKQTQTNGITLAELRRKLPDGSGSGTVISKLIDQMVRDMFKGAVPANVRFKLTFRKAESQE